MILGNLAHSKRIESLHPLFAKAFEIIKQTDFFNLPLGCIPIQEDELFIHNSLITEPKKAEEQLLEAHQKYIDIHIVLTGNERIGWKPTESCKNPVEDFNYEKDYIFYNDTPLTYVDLLPGQFLIVYPEDAHAPIISESPIRKIVVKIKL